MNARPFTLALIVSLISLPGCGGDTKKAAPTAKKPAAAAKAPAKKAPAKPAA